MIGQTTLKPHVTCVIVLSLCVLELTLFAWKISLSQHLIYYEKYKEKNKLMKNKTSELPFEMSKNSDWLLPFKMAKNPY